MAKKNNPTMESAAVLVALVLITSCFVGSTFAKYVTNGDLTGSARVAKFGVNVTSNGSMFAKEYDTDTQNIVATIAKSVVSTDNVVAPGTKGNAVSTTLSGTPEVAVKLITMPPATLFLMIIGKKRTVHSTAPSHSRFPLMTTGLMKR